MTWIIFKHWKKSNLTHTRLIIFSYIYIHSRLQIYYSASLKRCAPHLDEISFLDRSRPMKYTFECTAMIDGDCLLRNLSQSRESSVSIYTICFYRVLFLYVYIHVRATNAPKDGRTTIGEGLASECDVIGRMQYTTEAAATVAAVRRISDTKGHQLVLLPSPAVLPISVFKRTHRRAKQDLLRRWLCHAM